MSRCEVTALCALYTGHERACVAAYGGTKAAYFVCLDLSTSSQYDQVALLAWLGTLWQQVPQGVRETIEADA
jgi:hypothetical protein